MRCSCGFSSIWYGKENKHHPQESTFQKIPSPHETTPLDIHIKYPRMVPKMWFHPLLNHGSRGGVEYERGKRFIPSLASNTEPTLCNLQLQVAALPVMFAGLLGQILGS